MWDYKVVAGRYSLEGADVVVENPQGKTTLQRALDFYGNEGFELVDTQFDAINREVIVLMKRARGGAAPAAAGASSPMAAVAPRDPVARKAPSEVELDEDGEPLPVRRGAAAPAGGAAAKGGRRNRADLDRLAREE